jgi:hypothetical protein
MVRFQRQPRSSGPLHEGIACSERGGQTSAPVSYGRQGSFWCRARHAAAPIFVVNDEGAGNIVRLSKGAVRSSPTQGQRSDRASTSKDKHPAPDGSQKAARNRTRFSSIAVWSRVPKPAMHAPDMFMAAPAPTPPPHPLSSHSEFLCRRSARFSDPRERSLHFPRGGSVRARRCAWPRAPFL